MPILLKESVRALLKGTFPSRSLSRFLLSAFQYFSVYPYLYLHTVHNAFTPSRQLIFFPCSCLRGW